MKPKSEINAKKETWGKEQAIELLKDANTLHVARGKKVIVVNLKKDDWSQAELLKVVLGPTGNLRAPTLRLGKRLIVGFNQEMYESLF